MCGRTACTLNPQQLSSASRYRNSRGKDLEPKWKKGDEDKYRTSYNKAPQSFCPVLLHARHLGQAAKIGEDDERVLVSMKWGLVPSWVKDPSQAQYKMNNARSDTMLSKASYKRPLEKGQRCVMLADGFYEWNTTKTEKQPYFIYFRGDKKEGEAKKGLETKPEKNKTDNSVPEPEKRLVTMAGIFECRKSDGGKDEDLYTFSVITVDSHPAFSWLHHRMPAMLENDEEVRKWLDSDAIPLGDAIELIKPKDCLAWHPVSKFVNNSRNNSPECLEKIDLGETEAVKQSKESQGMAKWLTSSQTKVKQEVSSPAKSKDGGATLKIKTESTKNDELPSKSPTKKGKKRPPGSKNLMEGWLKKAKRE